MEACRVEEEKPEWRTVGTMAEGRSFLGSAAVGGKVTLTGILMSLVKRAFF